MAMTSTSPVVSLVESARRSSTFVRDRCGNRFSMNASCELDSASIASAPTLEYVSTASTRAFPVTVHADNPSP
jgi:hypothetical protein